MVEGSSAISSSCTVTYVDGTASVSCVDSTSSGYQVILLQDNDPYNLTVVNVRPGENQTVPVVPSGRYCIMEVSVGDSKIEYFRELTTATPPSTGDVIGIASKLVSSFLVCIELIRVHVIYMYFYSWCCGTVHIHDIDHTNNCGNCGYYQDEEKNMGGC